MTRMALSELLNISAWVSFPSSLQDALPTSSTCRDCQSKRDVTLLMNCMVFYMH